MTVEMFVTVLHDYGWAVAMALFILYKVYPSAWRFWSHNKQQEVDIKLETLRTQQEEERKAAEEERKARQAEREFRHSIDERQAKAYEKLAEATQSMVQLLTTMNERLNQLQSAQMSQTSFIVNSVTEMRESVARFHQASKELKRGD